VEETNQYWRILERGEILLETDECLMFGEWIKQPAYLNSSIGKPFDARQHWPRRRKTESSIVEGF
jgi:hypothetical protein